MPPTPDYPPPPDVTSEDDVDYSGEPEGEPADWLTSLTAPDAPDPVED